MTTPIPSQEAIAIAVKLSGHTSCQMAIEGKFKPLAIVNPCDGCLADAQTIDATLMLPQRNAALLIAQGILDITDRLHDYRELYEPLNQLRDALAAITKTP